MRVSPTLLSAVIGFVLFGCSSEADVSMPTTGATGGGAPIGVGGAPLPPSGTGGTAPAPSGVGGTATTPQGGAGGTAPVGAGGMPVGAGGMPVGAGGMPVGAGGMPVGAGGMPVGAGGAPPGPVGTDADGDGRPAMATKPADPPTTIALYDCDDADQTIFRGAPEVCGDGKDNNCNGMMDETDCIEPVGNVTCKDVEFMGKKYAQCGKGAGNLWIQPKARLVCLMKGMDLIQIDSEAENAFALSLTNEQTWIGCTDFPDTSSDNGNMSPTGEQWRWGMDEKVFFTGKATAGKPLDGKWSKWGTTGANPPQQPNNQVGPYNGATCREGCAVIRTTQGGSWYDICCNHRTGPGICEARK